MSTRSRPRAPRGGFSGTAPPTRAARTGWTCPPLRDPRRLPDPAPRGVPSVRLRYGSSHRRYSGRLGALSWSITQTTLVVVGIPLLVVLAVHGAVYGPAARLAS